MAKKHTHGGKRPGSGAKKKALTDVLSIRHDAKKVKAVKKKYGIKLQKIGRKWIDSL